MENHMNTIWQAAKQAFSIEADGILSALAHIPEENFMQAVDVLSKAQRIAASGCGHSAIACEHFVHLMCCVELPARFISPAGAIHGDMGYVQAGDVMLFASRGGKTKELLPILDICRKKGATVISVTENMDSPLAKGADIVLPMSVTRETDRYNTQGTTSFAVMNVIFDALQAALMEKLDYKSEQFAVIHPGGAVGERLNGTEI